MNNIPELLEKLKEINVIVPSGALNKQSARMLERYPNLLNSIMELTAFLGPDESMRARLYSLRNGITSRPKCGVCGADMNFNPQLNRFNNFCNNVKGSSCVSRHQETQDERKRKLVERYGSEHATQNPEVRRKTVETNIKKYGCVSPTQNDDVKQKTTNTFRTRYGVECAAHIPGMRGRIENTNIKKFGTNTYAESMVPQHIRDKLSDKTWLTEQLSTRTNSEIAAELGTTTQQIRKAVRSLGLEEVVRPTTSQPEREIQQLLLSNNILFETNVKTIINPKEIDIYVPELKLGIEFNGIIFHSEKFGRGRTYHTDKRSECISRGIRLLQIWSNDWEQRQEIVKSRLLHAIGRCNRVYARKCEVVEVESKRQREFFESTHIQGYVPATIAYGLMIGDELVACMSFVKSRYNKSFQWELLRYSSELNTSVVGGASRLFAHFVEQFQPTSIISYCDYRYGTGNLYAKLGFAHSHDSKPNYFYFQTNKNTNHLMSRVVFQKHKLEKILPIFDPEKTEWENMVANDYSRIWDCGNGVFVWNV